MYTNLVLPRHLLRLPCLCRYSTSIESQKVPQNAKSADGISPPPRIRRGPTDILQALAATVGNDPTAAHYKYHDDPFLIPLSNFRKRAYALSAEAGRKAAVWVRDEHAEWFTTRVWDPPGKKKTPHFNADPHIDAYAPCPIYNEESKVTEEDLKFTIENCLVVDSIKVFELLGGISNVNDELKLKFLQLLCFYNEKDSGSLEWLEERWFSTATRERQATTWKLGGLAEQIFNAMDPKTPAAYCAMIQGMAKYYQAERAHQLCQEAIEKSIPLSTSVYNSLLGCVGFLREGSALRTQILLDTLREMEQQNLSPDSKTLTSCLHSVSAWGAGRHLQQLALQLLAEFRNIGIEPGLSAYYYLLCLFCKEYGPRNNILTPILNDLESREKLEAAEPTDVKFFITAMGVCCNHLQDLALAERVHALLMKGDNYKLVGDAYRESIYYRHLVTITCRQAPLEKTTELLDQLVPNIYIPEPSVMEEIIKTLEVGGLGDRLAQTWSQLVIFGLANRTKLVDVLLNAMCSCYSYQEEEVKEKLRAAAGDVLKFGVTLEDEHEERKDLRTPVRRMSASTLCNIIELCSDINDNTEESWAVVSQALTRLKSGKAVGVPARPEVLTDVAKRTAQLGQPKVAAMAVGYLAECGFDEANSTCVQVLGVLLNRPEEEIAALLEEPRSKLATNLDNSALAIVDAYQMAGTAVRSSTKTEENTSSSESDSDYSDTDDDIH